MSRAEGAERENFRSLVFSQPPRSGGNLCDVLPVSLSRRCGRGRATTSARFARNLAGPFCAALRSLVCLLCVCACPRIGPFSLLRSQLSVTATFARFASARSHTFPRPKWQQQQQPRNLFAFVSPAPRATLLRRRAAQVAYLPHYLRAHALARQVHERERERKSRVEDRRRQYFS